MNSSSLPFRARCRVVIRRKFLVQYSLLRFAITIATLCSDGVCLFYCSTLKQTANCRRVQSPLASASLHEAHNIYSLESRRLTYLNTGLLIIQWNKIAWTDAVVVFLRGYVKDSVFLPSQNRDILQRVWAEIAYWLDVRRVTKGGHMEHEVWIKNWESFSFHL